MNTTESELFVGGQFRTAGGVDPVAGAATEQLLGNAPSAGRGDIDDAVAAAERFVPAWRATPVADRALILGKFADVPLKSIFRLGSPAETT